MQLHLFSFVWRTQHIFCFKNSQQAKEKEFNIWPFQDFERISKLEFRSSEGVQLKIERFYFTSWACNLFQEGIAMETRSLVGTQTPFRENRVGDPGIVLMAGGVQTSFWCQACC